mmetsp:Transcript_47197/g.131775  ORF Transcript_47197/g.131775 Transcript_47197/m.131775 type:complete len:253 (-) Transcript_47197:325-1083(-)
MTWLRWPQSSRKRRWFLTSSQWTTQTPSRGHCMLRKVRSTLRILTSASSRLTLGFERMTTLPADTVPTFARSSALCISPLRTTTVEPLKSTSLSCSCASTSGFGWLLRIAMTLPPRLSAARHSSSIRIGTQGPDPKTTRWPPSMTGKDPARRLASASSKPDETTDMSSAKKSMPPQDIAMPTNRPTTVSADPPPSGAAIQHHAAQSDDAVAWPVRARSSSPPTRSSAKDKHISTIPADPGVHAYQSPKRYSK